VACPAQDALDLAWGPRRAIRPWVVATAVAVLFVGVVGLARLTGHWHTVLPDALLFDLVPRAAQFGHP
jgi:hypothetical protein